MKIVLNVIHVLFLVLASIFSSYLAYTGVEFYLSGNSEKALSINVVSLSTLMFSARHCYLYNIYGLEVSKLVAFPMIYFAMGLSIDIAMGSAIEIWAPLTNIITQQLSISINWIVAAVAILALVSTEY